MIKIEDDTIEVNGSSKDLIIETSLIVESMYDELNIIDQYILTGMLLKSIVRGRDKHNE